jgi:hypothetical protein
MSGKKGAKPHKPASDIGRNTCRAGAINPAHLRQLSVDEIKQQTGEAEYMARRAGLKVRADQ